MTFLYLEPRLIKVKRSVLYQCPHPQYTQYCNGLFVKTRRWQIECVECMKRHGTIQHHPLLVQIQPKQNFAILEVYSVKDAIIHNQ
jgi:hypothetical protein